MLETPKAIGTCKRNNSIDVTMGNQQETLKKGSSETCISKIILYEW